MKYFRMMLLFAAVLAGLTVTGCDNPAGNTKSDNSNLSALSLSNLALNPAFSAATTSYTASVPNAVSSTTVSATVEHAGATFSCTPGENPIALAVGSNTINVCVTAENGTTTKDYTVVVTRAAANADLTVLSLSEVTLSPPFSPAVTAYTAHVSNPVATTTVTATPAAAGSTVAVSPSNPADLAVGNNTVTITVTAENGTDTKTYTVVITRSDIETTNYVDTFNTAGSAANLVTTGYRSLTDDATRPMYQNVRGTVDWAGGIVTLGADDRFSIGANEITATTATTTPGGCFDFSVPTTLRIRFGAAGAGTATGFFMVFVNNNTTAARNSPMGVASRLHIARATEITEGMTLDLQIPTAAGPDSFISFYADTEVTSVQIDEITLVH